MIRILENGWIEFKSSEGRSGVVPMPAGIIARSAIEQAVAENDDKLSLHETLKAQIQSDKDSLRNSLIISLAGNPNVVPTWISPNDDRAYPDIDQAPDLVIRLADAIIAKMNFKP